MNLLTMEQGKGRFVMMGVKELLEERFGVTDVRADFIGPVIGAHTGCGTLGLFFVGTQR